VRAVNQIWHPVRYTYQFLGAGLRASIGRFVITTIGRNMIIVTRPTMAAAHWLLRFAYYHYHNNQSLGTPPRLSTSHDNTTRARLIELYHLCFLRFHFSIFDFASAIFTRANEV
jgi:hypothetical protein